jgi:hypothetical protein
MRKRKRKKRMNDEMKIDDLQEIFCLEGEFVQYFQILI